MSNRLRKLLLSPLSYEGITGFYSLSCLNQHNVSTRSGEKGSAIRGHSQMRNSENCLTSEVLISLDPRTRHRRSGIVRRFESAG